MVQSDTLTDIHGGQRATRERLLTVADRTIVRNEFVICYEEPIDTVVPLDEPNERGYITVWVDEGQTYERKQMLSGDDDWIQVKFGSLASEPTRRIERFIGRETAPQP